MERDTIKLSLEGHVSISDFRTAVGAFIDLLDILTDETNPESGVEWFVSDLRSGSATIEARAEFEAVDDGITAESVVAQFDSLSGDIQTGKLEKYSPAVRGYATTLTSVLDGRIPTLSIVTDKAWRIDKRLDVSTQKESKPDKGRVRTSIKGRIVTLDQKHALYFTLQEAFTNRNVRCYPKLQYKSAIGEHWTRGTWVLVEGTFNLFTAKPTLTEITDIVPLGDAELGSWRDARGVAPRLATGTNDSAADAIRKVRDGS